MTSWLHSPRGLDALANNGPRLLFADHHQRVEAGFRALLAATYADSPSDLVAHFREFKRELLDHLAAEEETILPAYEHFHPEDARRLRDDHARIRQSLMRIGVDAELHLIREQDVEALIRELRAHASHEDVHMYRWAQVHLPLGAKDALAVRIAAWLRRLTSA